ncbi:MAG: deoxyhypusine synthase family protein [Candidatus Lokiarchaeota archaeon]|nr:deoxyhypusine synthase family protein [Candidatus Lokiarchaeota archaeon]
MDNEERVTSCDVDQIGIQKGEKVSDLVKALRGTGFNAKRLAIACEIYETMAKDPGCVKILTLAGAMVPAGMRGVIADLVRCGFVDILVTTGANLTHDVIESIGCHHQQGSDHVSDVELHDKEINRIFDVYMPNHAYETMEDFIKTLKFDKTMPVVDFLDYLGGELSKLPDEHSRGSILVACHEKKVPVFCPAFTDCGLGIQLMMNHRGLKLDQFEDLNRMIGKAWDSGNVGVCIIGGGVPKNFTFQALQFSPNSAGYAIQVTTDRPEPGGLSGATLSEAISWGKVNAGARTVTVMCDATIAMPIILAYLKDTCLP